MMEEEITSTESVKEENMELEDFKEDAVLYNCDQCDFSATSQISFNNHKAKHERDEGYKCTDCGEVFNRLEAHLEHSLQNHGGLACTHCDKRFKNRKAHKAHISISHEGQRFECQLCGKELTSKNGFNTHMNTHTGAQPHKCKECGAAFADRGSLSRHKRLHTAGGGVEATCQVCGKQLARAAYLEQHMKLHSRREEGRRFPLAERVEGVALARRVGLARASQELGVLEGTLATWVRLATSPLYCSQCGYTTHTTRRLEEHEKGHMEKVDHEQGHEEKVEHQEPLNSKVKCNLCPVGCQSEAELRKHMKTIHGVWEELERKAHCCPTCPKSYSSKYHLKEHQGVCSGSSPTPSSPSLTREVVAAALATTPLQAARRFRVAETTVRGWVRAAEGAVCCGLCGKESSSRDALGKHMRRYHPGEQAEALPCPHPSKPRARKGPGAEGRPGDRKKSLPGLKEAYEAKYGKLEVADFQLAYSISEASSSETTKDFDFGQPKEELDDDVNTDDGKIDINSDDGKEDSVPNLEDNFNSDYEKSDMEDNVNSNDNIQTKEECSISDDFKEETEDYIAKIEENMPEEENVPEEEDVPEEEVGDDVDNSATDYFEGVEDCTSEAPKVFKKVELKTEHDEKEFVKVEPQPEDASCPQCGESMKSSKLSRHILLVHKEVKQFGCDICDFKTSRRDCVRDHMTRKHKGVVFSCTICPEKFKLKFDLMKHRSKSHSLDATEDAVPEVVTEVRSHLCTLCGKDFSFRAEMTRHVKIVHDQIKEFPCAYCPKMFFKKFKRDVHEMTHTGEKPFNCDQCVKAFRCQGDLNKHLKYEHNPELADQTFNCEICGKEFEKFLPLQKHKSSVHSVKERKEKSYLCDQCPVGCISETKLQEHKLIHTQEKNFTCPICDAEFNMEMKLKRHLERHDGGRNYQCMQCEKKYSEKRSLDQHISIFHEGSVLSCKICHKSFTREKGLDAHIKFVHEGLRQANCKICDKSFPRKSGLIAHMKFVHEGLRPVTCEACGIGFKDNRDLDKHKTKCTSLL